MSNHKPEKIVPMPPYMQCVACFKTHLTEYVCKVGSCACGGGRYKTPCEPRFWELPRLAYEALVVKYKKRR